jgi:tetratricopeptide (TPR) repeat protein
VLQLQPQVLATDYLPLVAELRFHHGWLQSLLGNKEEGARLMEQAVYDAEAGRADKLEVSILGKLVFAEGKRKRFEHAEQWGRLGAATLRRLGGEPVLEADLLLNRANLALMREQPEEARQLLERAQGLQAQALPPGHPKRARVSFTLGMTLLDLGELEPATQRLREALAQTEAAVGPLHLDVARRHHALSNVLRERKDFTGALGHARAAVDLQRRLVGPQHLDVAYALDELGMSLLALGQHEEALRVYQESLELKRALVESARRCWAWGARARRSSRCGGPSPSPRRPRTCGPTRASPWHGRSGRRDRRRRPVSRRPAPRSASPRRARPSAPTRWGPGSSPSPRRRARPPPSRLLPPSPSPSARGRALASGRDGWRCAWTRKSLGSRPT